MHDFQLKMHRKAFGGELLAIPRHPSLIKGGPKMGEEKEGKGREGKGWNTHFCKQIAATDGSCVSKQVLMYACLYVCV